VRLRTTYRLSNNQRKELLIQGSRLLIAVPVPPEVPEDFDPRRIIGLSMPFDFENCIAAEYQTLMVTPALPPNREIAPPTKGTQGVYGRLLTDEEYANEGLELKRPPLLVECVVAEFVPPTRRGYTKTIPLRWAGKVFLDGKEIDPAEEIDGHGTTVQGQGQTGI
jgi:hypothetical protein